MPYPGFKNNRDNDREPRPRSWREEVGEDKPARKQEPDTAGQTETFFTANVKLITFIVTMAVLLGLIGPWSVFQIKKWYEASREEQETKVLMTAEQLDRIVARGSALSWADFAGFDYEVVSEKTIYIRQYDAEDGSFYLLVTSLKEGTPVESVLLIDVAGGYEETELKAQ
ncbi:MAG: hypothetical protein J6R04_00260 [Clostridia bacterium]|nr:hypothetical protein [Clostridia bacterium]